MSNISIQPVKKIAGKVVVPGDKSISHRAIMLASIANGETRVENFLKGEDCLRTVEAFQAMGIKIVVSCQPSVVSQKQKTKDLRPTTGDTIIIHGKGLQGLSKPRDDLYLGNSGTTMRLILGILAGQRFECTLTGDKSLTRRPMKRVTEPLRMMGAEIKGRDDANYAPLTIKGSALKAIKYSTPIPSAQVKSAILLAALYADTATRVTESAKSRDHTERMLQGFGVKLRLEGLAVTITPGELYSPGSIKIPGDISSAAFLLTAGAIIKGSSVTVEGVGINPTRTGIIDVLKRMGANIEINARAAPGIEPQGDITVTAADLKGVVICEEEIPRLIDELPVLMVAACFAKGETIIKGARELRVKETDRINSMTTNLTRMGRDISLRGDEVVIKGEAAPLHAKRVKSFKDHRTAMAMAIAGLCAQDEVVVEDTDCIEVSFPGFMQVVGKLTKPQKMV